MARSDRSLEIDGEGAFWAVAGFAASLVVGVALRPLRVSAGLENVVVVYVIVVALAAAIGGRLAGLATSLSAALAYTWFFTTPTRPSGSTRPSRWPPWRCCSWPACWPAWAAGPPAGPV
jgi:K+-sensing histidine kinase KdpD